MPDRKAAIAIVGAVTVVVAGALLIVLFGYIPPPSFPSLGRQPDPAIPGTVAYLHSDGSGEETPCIETVAAAGGEPRRLVCRDSIGTRVAGPLAWTPEGQLVAGVEQGFGSEAVIIDPDTGQQLDSLPLDSDEQRGLFDLARERASRADGAEVATRSDSRAASIGIRLPDGTSNQLLEVEKRGNYYFLEAQWSPDGKWVLVEDSEGRLIILGASGSPGPRVLAEEATNPAWYIPGELAYTFEPTG